MSDRKAPSKTPPGAARLEPPPAPPMRVGRIEQLLVSLKAAGPFESKRIAEDLAQATERKSRSLTEKEIVLCREAARLPENNYGHRLLRIIERLTGERFLP